MPKIVIADANDKNCPVRNVISRIGDKWTILTLCTINANKPSMRFKDLLLTIPDISQKMLTATLRTLEEDGLIARKAYPEVPPRVEYSLTKRALTLMPHLYGLIEWAKENMDDINEDRLNYEKKRR